MTARVAGAIGVALILGIVPVEAQEHAPAKAPAKAAEPATPKAAEHAPAKDGHRPASAPSHGIVRRAPSKAAGAAGVIKTAPPAGAARSPEADGVKVTPAASTEAVAVAIAAAVKAVEDRKAAEGKKTIEAPRHVIDRPRVRAVPRRRYAVRWPSQRLEVRWTELEDRVRLSWNDPTAAADVHGSLEP